MADTNVNKVSMTEKQKVKEITDRLEEGLKELFESEKYKSYLITMSKFHNYSVNNTLQISMQMPEATLVAGYKAWQKNLGRHVIKGEGAIRIFAPSPYIYKDKAVMRKLDSLVGNFPDTYKLVEQDEISKTYSLSKSYISYRKPRAISTEQRERARRMMIRRNKAKKEDN